MSDPGGSDESATSTEQINQLGLPLWDKDIKKLSNEYILSESDIQLIIQSLFSNDYETRQKSIAYLNINQHVITKPLVDLLIKNITHHTLIFQLTYALEVIGKNAVPVLLEALNQIHDIKTPIDEAAIENICETLIRINDKNAAPVLLRHLQDIKGKMEQINKTIEQNTTPQNATASQDGQHDKPQYSESSARKKLEFYQMVRMKLHCLLGEMDSTAGLDDLLALLGDGNKRVNGEIIETLGKIGNKNVLIPLIRLYPIEANVSELGSRYIKLTCREIIRREKISKSDRIFGNLTDVEKDSLDKILAGYRNGHKN
ncbi:MAG: hypothetical protein V1709_02950 [Planctomycetota bacterium]